MSRPQLTVRTQALMGGLVSVAVPESQVQVAGAAVQAMADVDEALSIYKPDSEVSRLNRVGRAPAGPILRQALVKAQAVALASDGAFDITVGKLTLKAYGFGTTHEQIPSANDLKRWIRKGAWRMVRMTENEVVLPEGVWLDFGGIGKGLAVDRAIHTLTAQGVREAVVAAGGDIRCLRTCPLAIRNPFAPNEELARFHTAKINLGVSTSGTYERVFADGKTHHLLQPETGLPARGLVSVTLLSSMDNATLDALATAVAVQGWPKARELFRARPELGYLLVTEDKKVIFNRRIFEMASDWQWQVATDFEKIQVED